MMLQSFKEINKLPNPNFVEISLDNEPKWTPCMLTQMLKEEALFPDEHPALTTPQSESISEKIVNSPPDSLPECLWLSQDSPLVIGIDVEDDQKNLAASPCIELADLSFKHHFFVRKDPENCEDLDKSVVQAPKKT
jgi:hypothetical protein